MINVPQIKACLEFKDDDTMDSPSDGKGEVVILAKHFLNLRRETNIPRLATRGQPRKGQGPLVYLHQLKHVH